MQGHYQSQDGRDDDQDIEVHLSCRIASGYLALPSKRSHAMLRHTFMQIQFACIRLWSLR